MADKIILTDDPLKATLDYIRENLELIEPFILESYYQFSIRILPETHDKLPKEIVRLLESISSTSHKTEDSEELRRYRKDHYWAHTNSYNYHIKAKKALELKTNIVWDYEYYDYNKYFVFFDKNEFPEIIIRNINCCEDCYKDYKVMWKDG